MGKRGPAGPEGPSGAAQVEGVEAELAELRSQVEEGTDLGEVDDRLDTIEAELEGMGGSRSELCEELGLPC